MPASTIRRLLRGGVAAVASLALALVAAAPAGGATAGNTHFRGDEALAAWVLDDAAHTAVTVSAFDSTSQYPRGGPVAATIASVDIEQLFCDRAANQTVGRTWYGSGPGGFTVASQYRAASIAPTALTLAGTETRYAGCDDATVWDDPIVSDLPAVSTTVAAEFTANSAVVHDNSVFRESYGEARFVTLNLAVARYADVAASVVPDNSSLLLPPLGAATFAFIGHNNHIEITVGTCGAGSPAVWPHCA